MKLLLVTFLMATCCNAQAEVFHLDLNDDDSESLFDHVMNSGTTYLQPTRNDISGHYRTNLLQSDGTNEVLTYFLSTDDAFRIQCTAITDQFGSSDAKCFVEYDSTKFVNSDSQLSTGPYKNSSQINFFDNADIQSISQLVRRVVTYSTRESVDTTDLSGNKISQSLFQFDCWQLGHVTDQPTACRAVFLPRNP